MTLIFALCAGGGRAVAQTFVVAVVVAAEARRLAAICGPLVAADVDRGGSIKLPPPSPLMVAPAPPGELFNLPVATDLQWPGELWYARRQRPQRLPGGRNQLPRASENWPAR